MTSNSKKRGLAFSTRSDWGMPEFNVFAFGMHSHYEGDGYEDCHLGFGFYITFLGMSVFVGTIRHDR